MRICLKIQGAPMLQMYLILVLSFCQLARTSMWLGRKVMAI